MNLGNIYIGAFLALTAAAVGLSLLVGLCLRMWWRVPWGRTFGITIVLAVLSVFVANRQLHQPLFRAWHRAQNTLVPAAGCVRYEPEFAWLWASYHPPGV